MAALSAADALSPAIQRARTFLFRPFRWGTYLKLCLVALLTEGLGGNINVSSHRHAGRPPVFPPESSPFHFNPAWIVVAVMAMILALLLGGFLFYLITRLRFAYFYSLAYNVREIRPGWHQYREPAVRFFWMNIAVGVCFLLAIGVIALPFVAGFVRLFHESQAGGRLDVGLLISLLLPIIPIILLLIVVGIGVDLVLRDFMLPHYALENATAGQAWAAVWARIRMEKGPFFFYALLRVFLPIVAVVALFLVLLIPGIFFVAGNALIEVGIHVAFSGASGGVAALGVVLQVLVGLIIFAIAFVVALCFGGPVSTAIREYALIFYGGRYRTLGEILYPPTAPGMA